ncbi:hypothetical protein GCM10009642_27400 [Nocardiopsis metallicus]
MEFGMRVDVESWLTLVSRSGSFDARAAFVRGGADAHGGGEGARSEHRLGVDDPLHWEYTVSTGGREARWSCDGDELLHVTDERTFRSPVPHGSDPDEPWYFSTWLAVVDTRLVEMVRRWISSPGSSSMPLRRRAGANAGSCASRPGPWVTNPPRTAVSRFPTDGR